MVVYLNKVCRMDDKELLELVELELRELLIKQDFPDDDMPIVRGSGLVALSSSSTDIPWELMDVVDNYIPTSQRAIDQPFLMLIEDVFGIKSCGMVVTKRIKSCGMVVTKRIKRGKVEVGDTIEIIGMSEEAPRTTVVTGVEMFLKKLDEGHAGDNVGYLLRGIERTDIKRGRVPAGQGVSSCTRRSRRRCTC